MIKNNLRFFSYFLVTVFLTLGLSISWQSLLAAWTAPSANPPVCAVGDLRCDGIDATYVNSVGDTMTGDLKINNAGSWSQINHETNNPLYINSYDALQLRINYDGVGTSDFGVNNNANTRMFTITNAGNVGIGVVNPTEKLQVDGNINISAGHEYLYNGVAMAQASTTLNNYFFSGAGNSTMTGTRNVATGFGSFNSNTTGTENTANGFFSLAFNTTGSFNTAYGSLSLRSNTSGMYNSAFGQSSLSYNNSGSHNTATGLYSLVYNFFGSHNTATGFNSLLNTTGSNNTADGSQALLGNTTGSNNTAMGFSAGKYQADGTTLLETTVNSVYLGAGARGYNNNDSNTIVIGYNAIGLGANTAVIGNGSITKTVLQGNVGIGTASPSEKLDISGNIKATGYKTSDGSAGLTATINLRKADNTGACTITVKSGLITATTCP